MKRLFLFLITVILLSSCTYIEVNDSTKIPNVVSDVIYKCDSTQVDNVYVVETVYFHYYYNENKELIQKYDVRISNTSTHVALLFFYIVLAIVIGYVLRFLDE